MYRPPSVRVSSAVTREDLTVEYKRFNTREYCYPDTSKKREYNNNTGRLEFPAKYVQVAMHPMVEDVLGLTVDGINNSVAFYKESADILQRKVEDNRCQIREKEKQISEFKSMSFWQRVKFVFNNKGREIL
jgi:hypothetical protein